MTSPRTPQFGAILFRASELIGKQGADVFRHLGFNTPADRISIILALHHHGPMSSTDIARHIGHSRQLVETKLKKSVEHGLLLSRPCRDDSRRRVYEFTPTARSEVDRIIAVMIEFEAVYDRLWAQIGVDLESALQAMENALTQQSLTQRLLELAPHHAEKAAVSS